MPALPDMMKLAQTPGAPGQTAGAPPVKLSAESLSTLEAIQNDSPQLDNKYFRN